MVFNVVLELFMSPLVCPVQLNFPLLFRKILQVLHILCFFSIFYIFDSFPAEVMWCSNPSFHTEDNWVTQFTDSLMLRYVKMMQTFKQGDLCKLFLFCYKIFFFLNKLHKLCKCFPKDNIITIYTDCLVQNTHHVAFLNISKYLYLL